MPTLSETRMLNAAKNARRRALPPAAVVALCLAVFAAAAAVETIITLPPYLYWMFTDDAFLAALGEARQALSAGDFTGYLNVVMTAMTDCQPAWMMLVTLFATAAVIAAVLIFCLKIEKRSAESLGLHTRGLLPEYLAGLVIGAVLFSGAVGICLAAGAVTVTAVPEPDVPMIVLFFLGFTVQGFSEELLCRGFLMVSLSRRLPVWACILINAAFFAALHLGNPGMSLLAFVNLFLFGAFASLYALRRGSLWGIAAVHTIWNFVQGNLWGISVSGGGSGPSFLSTVLGEGVTDRLFNGGAFGLEGGLGVTLVLAVGIAVLLIVPTKKTERAPADAPDSPLSRPDDPGFGV